MTNTPNQTIDFSSNTIKRFRPRTFERRYTEPQSVAVKPAGPTLAYMLSDFDANFTYPLTPTRLIKPNDRKLIADVLNAREYARYVTLCTRKGIQPDEYKTV